LFDACNDDVSRGLSSASYFEAGVDNAVLNPMVDAVTARLAVFDPKISTENVSQNVAVKSDETNDPQLEYQTLLLNNFQFRQLS